MITTVLSGSFDPSGPFGGDVPEVPGQGAFGGIVVLFVLVLIGVAVFAVISGVRNYTAAQRGGLDPMTAKTQLAVALKQKLEADTASAHAAAQAPVQPTSQPVVRTLEERLGELDDLAARGVITAQERADARAKLLGGPAA